MAELFVPSASAKGTSARRTQSDGFGERFKIMRGSREDEESH